MAALAGKIYAELLDGCGPEGTNKLDVLEGSSRSGTVSEGSVPPQLRLLDTSTGVQLQGQPATTGGAPIGRVCGGVTGAYECKST